MSMNSAKKMHVFRKGCHFCELCEKDARLPRVESVDVRKVACVYENHSILVKHINFCKLCEKGARFQRGRIKKIQFSVNSAKKMHVSRG